MADEGADKCLPCAPGRHAPAEGSTECAWCASGWYNAQYAASACTSCGTCGGLNEVRIGCGAAAGTSPGECVSGATSTPGATVHRCWRASLVSKSCLHKGIKTGISEDGRLTASDTTCALRSAALRKYGPGFGAVPAFAPFFPTIDPDAAGLWTIEADSDSDFSGFTGSLTALPASDSIVHLRTATGEYLANTGLNAQGAGGESFDGSYVPNEQATWVPATARGAATQFVIQYDGDGTGKAATVNFLHPTSDASDPHFGTVLYSTVHSAAAITEEPSTTAFDPPLSYSSYIPKCDTAVLVAVPLPGKGDSSVNASRNPAPPRCEYQLSPPPSHTHVSPPLAPRLLAGM